MKVLLPLGVNRPRSLMRLRSSVRCRSLRDLMFLVILFALLTFYLGYYVSIPGVQVTTSPDGSTHPGAVGSALKRSILSQISSYERSVAVVQPPAFDGQFSRRLEQLLRTIEEQSLRPLREQRKVAVVRGQRAVVSRDLPLYQRVLEKHGFVVHSPPWYKRPRLVEKNNTVFYVLDKPEVPPAGPHLLLCMTFSDGDIGTCVEKKELAALRPNTLVNRIPGVRRTLWQKDALCSTAEEAKQLPALHRQPPLPACFTLPDHYHEFLAVAGTLGRSTQWLLKPLNSETHGTGPRLVDPFTPLGQADIEEYGRRRAVVQQLVPNPLTVFGQPVSVRLYVLMTSLFPLRAYVHSQGVVHHRYDYSKNFKKIAGRTWSLAQLWQYLAKNQGVQAVRTAVTNVYRALVHTLLLTEFVLLASGTPDTEKFRCRRCFHLLGFDVIFNSTLQATVTEVNGQPSFQESPREEDRHVNRIKATVVEDTASLLLDTTSVSRAVADSLQDVGVLGLNCHVSHASCLSQQDLEVLLDGRREVGAARGFRQLYPSVDTDEFRALAEEIEQQLRKMDPSSVFRQSSVYKTADLHHMLVTVEKHHRSHLVDDMGNFRNDIGDFNLTELQPGKGGLLTNSQEDPDLSLDKCSDDPATMPYLAHITVDPKLDMVPSFSPLVTEYFANVSYDQLLVRIVGRSQNCQTEVRIDDKYGPSRTTNYTLGVGENRISFLVVDVTHTEPWVINTYSLLIHRLPLTFGEPPFDPSLPHQVCSLKQECEMKVSPSEMCGVQKDRQATWDWVTYMSEAASLPVCDSGDAPGRWVLPCRVCAERKTCFWRESVWHPHRCQYPLLSRERLSQCLAGKKLLFIGDSTNRGVMYYVMERLNGTLYEWDKTHDIRVYNNVNGGATTVSFAYYPQFWLPTNLRPVFDKALYHLIQRSRPLKNNTNTILIVGGVQWLATQHLLMLLRALRVERLQGIRLVMKTLGAGFHQSVEGVHTLSGEEHRKLLLHSLGLADFAKHYNFEVVDTFNITTPRYKDFLQGKCACHFHKVVKLSASHDPRPRWPSRPNDRRPRYHVEGPINAIYSEILLSRICSSYVT